MPLPSVIKLNGNLTDVRATHAEQTHHRSHACSDQELTLLGEKQVAKITHLVFCAPHWSGGCTESVSWPQTEQ